MNELARAELIVFLTPYLDIRSAGRQVHTYLGQVQRSDLRNSSYAEKAIDVEAGKRSGAPSSKNHPRPRPTAGSPGLATARRRGA